MKTLKTGWQVGAIGGLMVVAFGFSLKAQAFTSPIEVSFPSLDAPAGLAVQLKAFWAAAPDLSQSLQATFEAPAVVLLHGCGGPYNVRGALSQRMLDYTALLQAQGFHVLVLDSFTPRGERELCTEKMSTRKVTMLQRRADALAAVAWVAAQPGVNVKRIGLLGWSNGGSAVLSATNERHAEVASAAVKPAFAVAFYPGCEADLKRGYQHFARVLLLVGEADDWTPAAPCKRLAQQAEHSLASRDATFEIDAYPGAFHGFDSTAPLRVRKDVPNGVNPGQGVTVGGDLEALRQSRARLIQFITAR